jgi:hypothetical protein
MFFHFLFYQLFYYFIIFLFLKKIPADAMTTYTTIQWKYLLPFIWLLKEKELW